MLRKSEKESWIFVITKTRNETSFHLFLGGWNKGLSNNWQNSSSFNVNNTLREIRESLRILNSLLAPCRVVLLKCLWYRTVPCQKTKKEKKKTGSSKPHIFSLFYNHKSWNHCSSCTVKIGPNRLNVKLNNIHFFQLTRKVLGREIEVCFATRQRNVGLLIFNHFFTFSAFFIFFICVRLFLSHFILVNRLRSEIFQIVIGIEGRAIF